MKKPGFKCRPNLFFAEQTATISPRRSLFGGRPCDCCAADSGLGTKIDRWKEKDAHNCGYQEKQVKNEGWQQRQSKVPIGFGHAVYKRECGAADGLLVIQRIAGPTHSCFARVRFGTPRNSNRTKPFDSERTPKTMTVPKKIIVSSVGRSRSNGTRTAWPNEAHNRGDHMDKQDNQITHARF